MKTYEELVAENTRLRDLLAMHIGQCNYCGGKDVEVYTDTVGGWECFDKDSCRARRQTLVRQWNCTSSGKQIGDACDWCMNPATQLVKDRDVVLCGRCYGLYLQDL